MGQLIVFLCYESFAETVLAQHCPAEISGQILEERLGRLPLDEVFLYRIDPLTLGWDLVPFDIQVFDHESDQILPADSDKDARDYYSSSLNAGLNRNLKLVFSSAAFSKKADQKSTKFPCKYKRRIVIRSSSSKDQYLYLFQCRDAALRQRLTSKAFEHISETRTVDGRSYGFRYNKKNHILFEKIWLKENDQSTSVSENAMMMIRSNVRNFFPLNFYSDDIESSISAEKAGEFSFSASLSFFLRIMFFKIDLELSSVMSFFPSSVHFPMILHLPVDAQKWWHPASGIFYSWQMGDADIAQNSQGMPMFDSKMIKQGYGKDNLPKLALTYCAENESNCFFSLRGTAGQLQREFFLDFIISRELVERGFFPQLSLDVGASARLINWPVGDFSKEDRTRIGVYFETSGLSQGEHRWDFWLRLGAPSQSDQSEDGLSRVKQCPVDVVLDD